MKPRDPARLIAVYKTYDGGEWLCASMSSIYNSVEKIYVFNSEQSWLGERCNTATAAIEEFVRDTDINGKVEVIPYDSTDEQDQYRYAIDYVNRENEEFDYVLIIDSDEIWDTDQLDAARWHIVNNPAPAHKVSIRTYVKSPYYQVTPPEPCRPCAFVRRGTVMKGVRGNHTPGMQLVPDVLFHHYTAVRSDVESVRRKIAQSNHADGVDHVSIDRWMDTVWDRLPHATDLHYSAGYERNWQGVRVIRHDELPEVLRVQNHPLEKKWRHTMEIGPGNLPFGELVFDDEEILSKHAQGRHNVVDLGTFHGRSAAVLATVAEHVTTVDIFENLELIANEPSREHYQGLWDRSPHSHSDVARNLSAWPNITVIMGRTHIPVASDVDFLFIDDDHSRDGVERVFAAYLPCLADEALVLFHDSIGAWAVGEFIEEVVKPHPQFEFVEIGGSITVWRFRKETS